MYHSKTVMSTKLGILNGYSSSVSMFVFMKACSIWVCGQRIYDRVKVSMCECVWVCLAELYRPGGNRPATNPGLTLILLTTVSPAPTPAETSYYCCLHTHSPAWRTPTCLSIEHTLQSKLHKSPEQIDTHTSINLSTVIIHLRWKNARCTGHANVLCCIWCEWSHFSF